MADAFDTWARKTHMAQPDWYRKGRLAVNPIGWHVTMSWQGRVLLGEITGATYQEHGASGYRLTVRHFNGEPWPIEPIPVAVTVLERTYAEAADSQ